MAIAIRSCAAGALWQHVLQPTVCVDGIYVSAVRSMTAARNCIRVLRWRHGLLAHPRAGAGFSLQLAATRAAGSCLARGPLRRLGAIGAGKIARPRIGIGNNLNVQARPILMRAAWAQRHARGRRPCRPSGTPPRSPPQIHRQLPAITPAPPRRIAGFRAVRGPTACRIRLLLTSSLHHNLAANTRARLTARLGPTHAFRCPPHY